MYDDSPKVPWGKIILGVIVAIAVMSLLTIGFGWFGVGMNKAMLPVYKANTKINVQYQETSLISNGTNAIFNYEWFYQQYADYQALQVKITQGQQAVTDYEATLPKDQTQWTYNQQQEVARLLAIVQGLQQQLADVATTYNARSSMYTRAQFKANNLPPSLSLSN